MNRVSSLMRNQLLINIYSFSRKRKRGNVNWQRRKQLNLLKKINYYTQEYQGQQIPNAWVTQKRLKSIAKHYQAMRNHHRGSNPIPQKIQKQMLDIFPQHSDYQYFQHKNRFLQQTQAKQALEQSNLQEAIQMLPQKIRKQFLALQNDQFPSELEIINMYNQQMQSCLPQEQKRRYNLLWIMQKRIKLSAQDLLKQED